MSADIELLYLADPLCPWSWGFAPVAQQVLEHYRGKVTFRVVLAGSSTRALSPLLDEEARFHLRRQWRAVQRATRQPFDERCFDREAFACCTDLPRRAVAAVRMLKPGAELEFLGALQYAFFALNMDLADLDSYPPILQDFYVREARFRKAVASPAVQAAVHTDHALARTLGCSVLPALFLRSSRLALRQMEGYRSLPAISPLVDATLKQLERMPQA